MINYNMLIFCDILFGISLVQLSRGVQFLGGNILLVFMLIYPSKTYSGIKKGENVDPMFPRHPILVLMRQIHSYYCVY